VGKKMGRLGQRPSERSQEITQHPEFLVSSGAGKPALADELDRGGRLLGRMCGYRRRRPEIF
jgi:hypothetical protein